MALRLLAPFWSLTHALLLSPDVIFSKPTDPGLSCQRVDMPPHGAYSAECCPPTGIASSKIEPSESDLTSRNLPPWFSTTVKQIASPSPIPPDFVVKNGSNIRSRSSTRIPGPESWTESITVE